MVVGSLKSPTKHEGARRVDPRFVGWAIYDIT
jgi:hypothetical protein